MYRSRRPAWRNSSREREVKQLLDKGLLFSLSLVLVNKETVPRKGNCELCGTWCSSRVLILNRYPRSKCVSHAKSLHKFICHVSRIMAVLIVHTSFMVPCSNWQWHHSLCVLISLRHAFGVEVIFLGWYEDKRNGTRGQLQDQTSMNPKVSRLENSTAAFPARQPGHDRVAGNSL